MRKFLILSVLVLVGCTSSMTEMGLWAPKAPSGMSGTPVHVETCYYDWWLLVPNDRFDPSEVLKAALPHGRTALANMTIERTATHWPYLTYVCFTVTGTAVTYPGGG